MYTPGSSQEGMYTPGSSQEGMYTPGSSQEGMYTPGKSQEGNVRARKTPGSFAKDIWTKNCKTGRISQRCTASDTERTDETAIVASSFVAGTL
ncbi:hypothetical protein MRX96_014044 [Rhipicephalus microplus]